MKTSEIINKLLSEENSAFFYTPPVFGKSRSYLFLNPEQSIIIKSKSELDRKLNQVNECISKGMTGYSLINYEAGYLLEKALYKYIPKNQKLIQFYFYNDRNCENINSTDLEFDEEDEFTIKNLKFNTSKNEFTKAIKKIKSYIEEGDTYQVNYTLKGKFLFEGSLSKLFTQLVFNQSAAFTAIIKNGSRFFISLSPELFFEIEGRKITSKPMKGTAGRGKNYSDDIVIKNNLASSTKNQAENLMIVDLIRNDIGRLSEFGSVKVKNLFEIEKYESLYQMVSVIEAKLRERIRLSDVLKNIFPCGSITGAPKLRTMEIIREIEKENRGIYTGSIGLIRKKKITFNVAIRTLMIDKTGKGEIGLGSGIVWDSSPEEEYEEIKLKGKFLTHPSEEFSLFETMPVEKGKIVRLSKHLKRLKNSAEYFLFPFDEKELEKVLKRINNSLTTDLSKRLKLFLNKKGKFSFELNELPIQPREIKIILSDNKIDSANRFQYFKTTNRTLYDREHKKYSAQGFFDVIYLNERNEIGEGAISNIFVRKGDKLFTPPLESGILPGIYRDYMFSKYKEAKEKVLTLQELLEADEIILTNSLRGETNIDSLSIGSKNVIRFTKRKKHF
ncbi:MAG: aminodeoxychorismate synthase component I [Ignavibacteriaceae bacterium]|nr:aminodeoxychorismate synthase component I [Ignavibacteriaceae bacterium]